MAINVGVETLEAGTLAGQTAAVKSVAAIDLLLMLDAAWSDEVRALDPEDQAAIESRRDEFTTLMDSLDGALVEAIARIRMLEPVLNSANADEVDGAIAALGTGNPQLEAAVGRALSKPIDDVGVRGAAIFACQFLVAEEDDARQALRRKYDELMEGHPPNPGLPKSVKCALYLAGLGAAAAAVIATHGAAAMAHAAIGPATGFALSWESSGCTETWQTITRHRFA